MSPEPSDGRRSTGATASTLLFDLDDTLVIEEQAAKAAFEETARFTATQTEVEAATLAVTARPRARDLQADD